MILLKPDSTRRSRQVIAADVAEKNYSVCIYPNISRDTMGSKNPYIEHLKESLAANGLVTSDVPAKNAFWDLIRNGFRSDMVILNWIEDLPSRRSGLLQSVIFGLYVLLLKTCGVRIIWIKHNKISHNKERFALKKIVSSFVTRFADHIIVHGRDADSPENRKLVVIPHPNNIKPADILRPDPDGAEPVIDFLIWGSLLPYKGVQEFLRYVDQNPAFGNFRIHIAGKCSDDYLQELLPYVTRNKNIRLVNAYVSTDELKELFRKSRFILFTYRKTSVISSGVLMDSLIACKKIIAPDCGAFSDMARQEAFVCLYNDFSGIIDLYRKNYNNYNLDDNQVSEFVARNSWYNMGRLIKEFIPGEPSLTPSAD